MLSEKMQDALNEQVKWEFYSAYMYLSMASYFESVSLGGCAKWMYAQFQEEQMHAMKMFRYVNERGGRALLRQIEEPPSQWDSPLAAFQETCEHEALVTGRINALMDLALDERDHATANFLNWYVDEQVEEEDNCGGILERMKLAGEGAGLFMLDQELGQRVFTPPPEEA